MIEFGEKLKQAREKKGMTQATLAGQLYVTRQAVSRWECGARYPDLLTTKKISQILGVSIDELVSGEEFGKNVENEPLLAKPVPNLVQTMLYCAVAVAYLLMSIFAVKSFFPGEALKGTVAGIVTVTGVASAARIVLSFAAVAAGLYFSGKNMLTPKRTGLVMSAQYGAVAAEVLVDMVHAVMGQNGAGAWLGMIDRFVISLVSFICILLYFSQEKIRVPALVIYGIAVLSVLEVAYMIRVHMPYMTELSFVLRSVTCIGRLGLAALLVCQAYTFSRKRRGGIRTMSRGEKSPTGDI